MAIGGATEADVLQLRANRRKCHDGRVEIGSGGGKSTAEADLG
jgi:hypothetical protein